MAGTGSGPSASDTAPAPPGGRVLVGTVERVLFARPETGWQVVRVTIAGSPEPVTVVGELPVAEPGLVIRAEGGWVQDPTWGRQFRASSALIEAPRSEEGLRVYLASGRIKGLGEVTARRLIARFGAELPRIIERQPDRLREVPGIGRKLVARLSEAWRAQRAARELIVFLGDKGIGPATATRILKAYGERAQERIMADPYALIREVRGIGFGTADALALRLGVGSGSPQRAGAALVEILRRAANDGHTCVASDTVARELALLLGPEAPDAATAIAREVALGHLVERPLDRRNWLLLPELDAAEGLIAARLAELVRRPPPWQAGDLEAAFARSEQALGLELASRQRSAIAEALGRRCLVVTGGPGPGKTTLVRGILAALEGRARAIALAAPTGRAARRLAESTGREARTLHRLLEAEPLRGFRRNAERPLECDLLVVDEASMIDTGLMAALLDALPEEAALLLVGDADQLPSIGPGQVLADLIAAGTCPTLRLTEIFRQAAESAIVRNAHRINQGLLPEMARSGDELVDFYGIRIDDPEDAAAKLVELVATRIPERFGIDPLREVQVLTPVNRGPLGTRALNARLQARLNPDPGAALEHGGQRFGRGDRVMQLENDYEHEVYNGDVGVVSEVDPGAGALDVAIDGRSLGYAGEALDKLSLAYAVTVHKAQGSQYPAVVMPLVGAFGRMLRRNLLYTAITRAQRLVVLLVEPQALERAARSGDTARDTLLRPRLVNPELLT